MAWCDGAAFPNPGRIGLGGVLISPAGERRELSRLAGVSGCNNEAELRALLALLELACHAGARRLLIAGDSRVVLDLVVAVQAGAPWPEPVGAQRWTGVGKTVSELLQRFESVRLRWTPAHRNREADALARQALGLSPRPPVKNVRRRRS